MCLVSKEQPQVISEDIITFKLLEEEKDDYGTNIRYFSPYTNYYYDIGKLEKTEIRESRERIGFDGIDMDEAHLCEEPIKFYGQGYHSFYPARIITMNKWSYCIIGTKIGIMKIPKGSTIINGFTQAVISSQIILEKVVTWEEALEIALGRSSEDDSLPSDSLSTMTQD